MCAYVYLMPPPTLSHFSIWNIWHKHARALCCSSKIKEWERRREVNECEPVIFRLRMAAFWVSLWLIISYQSFNSGARSGRFKPWKQLALCSPTVRVSFAVDDGNIKPVSREWTSQSESVQPSLPLIIHGTHTRISSHSVRPSLSSCGNIKLGHSVKLEMKWTWRSVRCTVGQ